MLTLPSPLPADISDLTQKLQSLVASERAWITKRYASAAPAFRNIERWQSMLETLAAIDREVVA